MQHRIFNNTSNLQFHLVDMLAVEEVLETVDTLEVLLRKLSLREIKELANLEMVMMMLMTLMLVTKPAVCSYARMPSVLP